MKAIVSVEDATYSRNLWGHTDLNTTMLDAFLVNRLGANVSASFESVRCNSSGSLPEG